MTATAQPHSRRPWAKVAALFAAGALIVAACGGDDDDTSATDANTDTSTTEASGDAASGLLADLQESGSITIGIANEVPYGYEDEDGNVTGEAPEVARLVLAELGIDNVNAEVVDFGSLIPGLQAGQFDMIAAGMYITPDRAEQIIFSDPDYCVGYSIAVAAGNPEGISDFASIVETGAKIAVLSGAVDEDYVADAGIPDDQIELFGDVNAQYDALSAGRVDAVGGTSLTVGEQAEANDGIEATESFFPLDENGDEVLGCGAFGFLDQEFRDAYNTQLNALQDTGAVQEIVVGFGFNPDDVDAAAALTVQDFLG